MTCRATLRVLSRAADATTHTSGHNPYRAQVLSWYRKCLRAAFAVAWESDADALYVLAETRRLFRANSALRDVDVIERKVREVEMRYELALHYRVPYPRALHKTQGATPQSTVAYAAYLDSSYDHAVNYNVGVIAEGSANFVQTGGGGGGVVSSSSLYTDMDEDVAVLDGRGHGLDTTIAPVSTHGPE